MKRRSLLRAVFLCVALLAATEARAQTPLYLSVNFDASVPLGPFKKNQTVKIVATVTNTSPDQPIILCEGICVGDAFTYSLGVLASGPDPEFVYTFHFGNGKDTSAGFLNGQLAGVLLPSESKTFVFGEFVPVSKAEIGTYAFRVQLQIFAATVERPMIGSSTLSGTWQVVHDNRVNARH
jgi:hypothetical protein